MNFNKKISECIERLRDLYKNSRTCVVCDYPVLEIVAFENDKEISQKLVYGENTGLLEIQEPTYKYYSRISHYDFKRTERRWTRDKKIIFKLITDLKKCELWDFISNKNFLVVNNHNENVDIKQLKSVLKQIIK